MRGKELCLVEENHGTLKPDSSVGPRGMKTYSERRIELRNLQILQKLLEKSSPFLSSKQPCKPKIKAWMLPWKIAGVEKYPRKTCDCGQPRGHLIRVLNERSVNGGGEYCLLWLVIPKSVWYSVSIVSKTHLSCDNVGRQLWLAILSSLLCPETDWNICIGKQGYVFILSDFIIKRWCFDVSHLTSISV